MLLEKNIIMGNQSIKPVSWIASIWSDEQIILVVVDEVHAAEITWKY